MRLVDADDLREFYHLPESGTEDMITNWIYECGLGDLELYVTEECPIDVEQALKDLCKKVIEGCKNVVDTQHTAYDVEAVCKELLLESVGIRGSDMIDLNIAEKIVRSGGI